ncbi:twin-arginine translocation signal domain-containing protein [Anatilimnocola sp. NA78]|uniref:twin-arginine translocation signal domain-containing protein n=1 Tax=Anatilimnocola sp. NA78 TaxID=3415683 RepID=UPI003CE4C602
MSRSRRVSRRQFLHTSAAVAAVTSVPAIWTTAKAEKPLVVGEGEHKFEVQHEWPQLPAKYSWQTTHNVAVDKAGNLYVIHEGRDNLKDHPSIFVFDSEGKFVRAFGEQFQGGGHGIEIRQEGSEEFLYVCAYQALKTFAKLTLTGEKVWQKFAPMESGVYAADEDTKPAKVWGRDRFLPTNFAFLDDGGFLLVDGYGAYYVHRYDKDGKWLSCFGGVGKGEGKFNTPHGIWVDKRAGRKPSIVVCDRANNTLQYFDMEGKYLETLAGYGLPANAETWNNLLVIPELKARVTLLNEKNEVVARLGDDVARINAKDGGKIRGDKNLWEPGRFVHPHDACFGADGSIFVAEWVGTGRVSRLKKLT